MSKKEIFPGIHTVSSLLRWQPERIQSIWVEQNKCNKRIDQLIEQAKKSGVSIQQTQHNKLDQICESTHHQGIAASCSPTKLLDEHDLVENLASFSEPPLLLILDEVSDPHNLGACLRSADAAGVDAVILPQRHSAPLTPTVHKIASGATVRLKIVRTPNLARFLDQIKKAGVWVYGATGESDHSIYDSNLSHPSAIVMGAEGQGLRRLTQVKCDQLFALPMLGDVESLNVSVATGIFLYEAVRQRQNSDSKPD
ncbi:MAG: 23S rRNA (guanosine(2251)-2'-O)-methyltransferase RlmB [Pseudomonadota bacterium]